MLKNQKGITLIALVVTIIVLLILAGVSIAMLTGNNGILTQASETKDAAAKAEVEEVVKLSIAAVYAASVVPDSSVSFDIDAIATEANNTAGSNATVTRKDETDYTLTYEASSGTTYEVTLTEDLKTIDGDIVEATD